MEKMAHSFIARAHPPVLFMKCVAFNQNLFEFHPCLAHEAGRCCRVWENVTFQGSLWGDEGREGMKEEKK